MKLTLQQSQSKKRPDPSNMQHRQSSQGSICKMWFLKLFTRAIFWKFVKFTWRILNRHLRTLWERLRWSRNKSSAVARFEGIFSDETVGDTHHNGYDVALLNVGGDSAQDEIFTPGLDKSGKPEGPRTGSTNFLWLVKLKPKLFLFYKSKLEESVCRCWCGSKLTRHLVPNSLLWQAIGLIIKSKQAILNQLDRWSTTSEPLPIKINLTGQDQHRDELTSHEPVLRKLPN